MPNCHTKRGGKYAIKREVSTSRMFRIDILGLILSQKRMLKLRNGWICACSKKKIKNLDKMAQRRTMGRQMA